MVIQPDQSRQSLGWTCAEYTTRWMGGSHSRQVRIYSELSDTPTGCENQDIHVVSVHQIPRRRLYCGDHRYTLTTSGDKPPLSRSGGRITDDELHLRKVATQSPDSFHHVKELPF